MPQVIADSGLRALLNQHSTNVGDHSMTRLFAGTPFDIPPQCNHCGKLESDCKCPSNIKSRIAPERQTAKLHLEKRKKGKMVTVITGLTAAANDLPALLTQLKNACGAGGCVADDSVEIQGEHLERASEHLRKIGYKIR